MAPALLAALLTLASCASSERSTEPQTANEAAQNEDAAKDNKGGVNGDKKKEGKPGNDKQRERGGEDSGGDSAGGKTSGGGSADEDRDEGVSANRGSGGTAAYPASGTYTFAQSGYEEFCDSAGRCDKEDLPARQPTKVTYEQRTEDSAVVVTEQNAGSRVARTWTRFTPSGAHITKLYVRMVYSGFRMERTYVPQPPVEAFRFPFQEGEGWSGRWKAETSGTYSVKIGAPRRIEIGGRTVTAYPVDTSTTFTGDFEGRSRITAFVDPRTKSIVASDGALNVTSQFGRYSTVFETKLVGGPGY